MHSKRAMGDLAARVSRAEEQCAPPPPTTPFFAGSSRASFSVEDELAKQPGFSGRSSLELDGLLSRDQNSNSRGGARDVGVVFESASALGGGGSQQKRGTREYLEELYGCGAFGGPPRGCFCGLVRCVTKHSDAFARAVCAHVRSNDARQQTHAQCTRSPAVCASAVGVV